MIQTILDPLRLMFKAILIGLLAVLAGCSTLATPEDFIAYGDDLRKPCSGRISSYTSALNTSNAIKKMVSDENMAVALGHLKRLVPSCTDYEFGDPFNDVTYSLDKAIAALSEVNSEYVGKNRNSTVQQLAVLLLAYANSRPSIPVYVRGTTVTHLQKIDSELARQLLQLGLERGFWTDNDFSYMLSFLGERRLTDMNPQFSELHKAHMIAYDKARKIAGPRSCFNVCQNESGYRRALLEALQEVGLGGSVRAKVLTSMLKQEESRTQRANPVSNAPAAPSSGSGVARPGSGPAAVPQSKDGPVCNGDFAYLAPRLPKYRDPILANFRNQILSNTMAKERGNTNLNLNIQTHDTMARQAAEAANSTFGGPGQSTIQLVDGETLSLDWRCQGVHGSAVCTYIINTWAAMMYRELAIMRSVCTAKGMGR